MKRPYGTGQIYEKWGAYYGRWAANDFADVTSAELLHHVPGLDWEEPPPKQRRGSHLVMPDVDALRAELKALLSSWEYAFAMGHGCSNGDHPGFRATRERAADLRARIAEHTE
jgi:hypothetical protein